MYDINSLLPFVLSENTPWYELETRPEFFQYNHYMKFCDLTKIKKTENEDFIAIYNFNDKSIKEFLNLISIENKMNIANSYFIKLEPQQYPIRQYYESEDYSEKIIKVLIPIVVNKESKLCIDNDIFSPNPGEKFLVTEDSLYSIYNSGDQSIIYLFIDLFKN